jgi:signal transduction histidine kinase
LSGRKHIKQVAGVAHEDQDLTPSTEQLRTIAAGVAHDLNTVITTIYGLSELALESIDDSSETSANIKKIILAADRARSLTGQLLDLSLTMQHEPVKVRVEEIINETLELLTPSVPPGIEVTCSVRTPDILVEAVPVMLFRVFMNIIVNSVQSMENGGGRLAITLDRVRTDKGINAGDRKIFALIRFEDTGKGMDAATMAFMLRPYYTERKDKGGTGLGLAVVDRIVRDHGGSLRISSAKESGTVTEVLLPAVIFGSDL